MLKNTNTKLTDREKRTLLAIVRQTLEHALTDMERPVIPADFPDVKIAGLFVTIKRNKRLRGCVGHIQSVESIIDVIERVTLQAAFHDPRFPPVQADELPDLDFEITLLEPFRMIDDPEEVIVGKHGLMIRGWDRQGLLLPQVAVERGWNRVAFLENTCMKAGLPVDAYLDDEVEIFTFAAEYFAE